VLSDGTDGESNDQDCNTTPLITCSISGPLSSDAPPQCPGGDPGPWQWWTDKYGCRRWVQTNPPLLAGSKTRHLPAEERPCAQYSSRNPGPYRLTRDAALSGEEAPNFGGWQSTGPDGGLSLDPARSNLPMPPTAFILFRDAERARGEEPGPADEVIRKRWESAGKRERRPWKEAEAEGRRIWHLQMRILKPDLHEMFYLETGYSKPHSDDVEYKYDHATGTWVLRSDHDLDDLPCPSELSNGADGEFNDLDCNTTPFITSSISGPLPSDASPQHLRGKWVDPGDWLEEEHGWGWDGDMGGPDGGPDIRSKWGGGLGMLALVEAVEPD
jgi:hypothetical protein